MNIAQIREALLWCVILNIGFVTVWSILVLVAKGWLNGIILKWFRVPAEHCDMINLTGIVLYKSATSCSSLCRIFREVGVVSAILRISA
jgi:hypothetical protein